MNCKEAQSELIFYIEGTVSSANSDKIAAHLQRCKSCAAEYQFLMGTLSTLEITKKTEVKPFLYTRIQGKMLGKQVLIRNWKLSPLAIASVLTIGLVIGTLVGNLTTNQIRRSISADYEIATLFNDANLEVTESTLLND